MLQTRLAQLSFVPIVFISALSGQRVQKALTLAAKVYGEHHRRIETTELNEFLRITLAKRKPPAAQGKYIQIKYVTQSEVAPPTFVFFTSHARLLAKDVCVVSRKPTP